MDRTEDTIMLGGTPGTTAKLSPELALRFREFLTNHYDASEEAVTKAVYEVDLVLGKILEEMEVVLEGQVEVPITEEGAHKIVKAYLELPKSLQLAEESVDEGEAAKEPWALFMAMILKSETTTTPEDDCPA